MIGAVAMAAATTLLSKTIGWDAIVRHERQLTAYALERLAAVPGLRVVGPREVSPEQDRVGVISFVVEGIDHRLISAILGREHGIGTRSGCFCAHPYIMKLFAVPEDQARAQRDAIERGDRRGLLGLVRVSFGFYNTGRTWTGLWRRSPRSCGASGAGATCRTGRAATTRRITTTGISPPASRSAGAPATPTRW